MVRVRKSLGRYFREICDRVMLPSGRARSMLLAVRAALLSAAGKAKSMLCSGRSRLHLIAGKVRPHLASAGAEPHLQVSEAKSLLPAGQIMSHLTNVMDKSLLKIRRMKKDSVFKNRLWMMIVGNVLCSTSSGILRYIGFGTDPYNSGVIGLWQLTGMFSFGTFSMIICSMLLAVDVLLLDRERLGAGTIFSVFLSGYVAEFTYNILNLLIPEPLIIFRILMLLVALFLVCYFSSMYYVADLGVSPYDCMPLSLAGRTRFKFRTVRIAFDCSCVAMGIIGGQMPGIATVLVAFCLGPLIEFFHPFNRSILQRRAS